MLKNALVESRAMMDLSFFPVIPPLRPRKKGVPGEHQTAVGVQKRHAVDTPSVIILRKTRVEPLDASLCVHKQGLIIVAMARKRNQETISNKERQWYVAGGMCFHEFQIVRHLYD